MWSSRRAIAHVYTAVTSVSGIRYEVVNINLVKRPQWYYGKNPLGKVPCLELPNGRVINESLIVCDYLDEVHPSHPLHSSDPLRKAEDRMLAELFGKVISGVVKFYYLTTSLEDELTWTEPAATAREGLEVFEKELAKRCSPFFGGDKPGMLDYMIWPWCERMPALVLYAQRHSVKIFFLDSFPLLSKWFGAMKEDVAVQESFISPENHVRYIMTHSTYTDHPDYDMELH